MRIQPAVQGIEQPVFGHFLRRQLQLIAFRSGGRIEYVQIRTPMVPRGARQCRVTQDGVQQLHRREQFRVEFQTEVIVDWPHSLNLVIPDQTLTLKRAKAAGDGEVKASRQGIGFQRSECSCGPWVQLVAVRQTKAPALDVGAAIGQRCLELGACLNIGRRSMSGVFRIAPPLNISRDEIDRAVSIFDQALSECARV